jgi:predicted nucleic-acid-binding Zn-ribbon protein
MNQFIQKQKEKVFKDALAKGRVFVGFVHKETGVCIPETMLSGQGLHFSRNFANPLYWDSESIKQRLTFEFMSFDVIVPWSAVVYISSADKSIERQWDYDGNVTIQEEQQEISIADAIKYGFIKPCPKCGSSNLILEGIAQDTQTQPVIKVEYYSFKCISCDHVLEYKRTAKEALDDWNEHCY